VDCGGQGAPHQRVDDKPKIVRTTYLGLLVSTDFHIPLFHRACADSLHDSIEFRSVTEELAAHYRDLAQACEHISLAFDKGNNSEEAFDTLAGTSFHFVGSLVPSQLADLLAVPRNRFHTVVVTFTPNLFEGQLQGLTHNLNKARGQPGEWPKRLRRWKQRARRYAPSVRLST